LSPVLRQYADEINYPFSVFSVDYSLHMRRRMGDWKGD
jgi:hypothetical protein